MNYDSIILELMGRIKTLEEKGAECERRLTALEDRSDGETEFVSGPREPQGSATPYTTTTDAMIDACYEKGVYAWRHQKFSPYEIRPLAAQIAEATGMNESSANMYVYVVACMLRGVVYKRAINQTATKRYFQRILADMGPEALCGAVSATRQHIAYRQGLGHQVPQLIALCDQFEQH